MNIDQIKAKYVSPRYQVVVMDGQGCLLDSCDSLMKLSDKEGKDLFAEIDVLGGMKEVIMNLKIGDPPFLLPMVEFSQEQFGGKFNFEFFRESGSGHLIWMIWTNYEVSYRLQQIQQERNDSVILLETIRQQQALLETHSERLESVNAGLDRFASVISHDLKAPLRAIRNLADWIAEEVEAEEYEEIPGHVALLHQRVDRMGNLIEAVLRYSRAGREVEESGEVDVRKMLKDLMEAEHSEQKLQVTWPASLPSFVTAKTSLFQVFANLIGNAVKYGMRKDDPRLEILFVPDAKNGAFVFGVRDFGPGIDPKHHGKIFEVFHTLQARDEFESSGIGLSIVRKLVEERGGEVWVESATGEGATFWFSWLYS